MGGFSKFVGSAMDIVLAGTGVLLREGFVIGDEWTV